jgi:hypothetical protein
MGRRGSKLCPVAVGLLALIAHGCTKKPEVYPKLSDLRVDYQSWNCRDLAGEADDLKTALEVAIEQRSAEHVAHLKAQTIAVQQAKASKKCAA